ncbi:uncharacterized protein EV422DRAFT_430358 [Fimicolochytrium jonesii]|uniref:uncharacterized protein n=1 Tax=Fimicolochytrium jonesii TaxID=1396493 RepID=UPI0022FDB697|nr:uncharacterized protein EV422DRAFT_430358 [Fimicolochytrium jonesii]KAI8821749.1 hypothetical protein EV422DRAFT_430358 [Fimicolochytrium jonesii]
MKDSLVPSVFKKREPSPSFFATPQGLITALLTTPLLYFALHPRTWKRYKTAEYVTPDVLHRFKPNGPKPSPSSSSTLPPGQGTLAGKCTSVRDNDNFRLYHRPFWHRVLRFRVPATQKELKDETIHVRLAGVDAPEAAHFGQQAQPYSAEAKQWLEQRVMEKTVFVRPLRRDQYGRLVSMVWTRSLFPPFRRNVNVDMLRAGWAVLYTATGAEYDGMYEELKQAELHARATRRGMWASEKPLVSPGEHKKAGRKA